LPACAKEYLTAATYYCQVEVKVRDRTEAVDAIFPPVSCSDIISKQYGGRRVGLQTSKLTATVSRKCRIVRRLQVCYIIMYLSVRLHHAFLFKYNNNKYFLRTCTIGDNLLIEACEYA